MKNTKSKKSNYLTKDDINLISPNNTSDKVHIFVMNNFFLKALVINNARENNSKA